MPTCPHGFPQGDCLICQTLGTAPNKGQGGDKGAGRAATRVKGRPAPTGAAVGTGTAAPVGTAGPGALALSGGRDGTGPASRSGRGRLWPLAMAVVAGAVLVWAFGGLFSLAFHIAEYVALALAAGWAGYKVGYARGEHRRR